MCSMHRVGPQSPLATNTIMCRTAIFVLAALPVLLFAQGNAKVPDPDPEIERKTFHVADGFEVNLFAADPLLAKPIQMNFDPQGRLWVASSEVYPQIKPGQKANDKIIILEDTKGVGKADKTTVFADGLLIPTGVEPGDGGVYVANSTELLHLSRPKPGDKADKTRVVLSGFGTEDTHHIVHTFRWGPDGMLYFNQSHLHSQPHRNAARRQRLNGGGIWQFRPETMRPGSLRPRLRGIRGAITSTAGASRSSPTAPAAKASTTASPARLLRHGHRRRRECCTGSIPAARSTAAWKSSAAGICPDDWQGDCITNDFRGHRVCRFKLARRRQHAIASREMTEADQDEPPGLSADRREDGPGRRDLHRRLVQPDHPARRSRFPRSAPRPRRTAASGASPPRAGRSCNARIWSAPRRPTC